MTPYRIAFSLLGAGLAALIVWAMRTGEFSAAGAWLTSDPWGIVTLADLYLGFALAAAAIALFERSLAARLFWITPIFVLGNVWTVAWFVLRGPSALRRLSRDGQ